jgi:hypothetical protein
VSVVGGSHDVVDVTAAHGYMLAVDEDGSGLDQRLGVAQPGVHGLERLGIVGQLPVEVRALVGVEADTTGRAETSERTSDPVGVEARLLAERPDVDPRLVRQQR